MEKNEMELGNQRDGEAGFGREALAELLADYYGSGQMKEDFMGLTAQKRLEMASRLLQYVTPKMKALGMEVMDRRPSRDFSLLDALFAEEELTPIEE